MSGENQWEALRDKAADGGFTFDTTVGRDAAEFCADLVNVCEFVESGISEVENVQGLGHLPGAVRLAGKFSELAADMREVLKAHKSVVTDLGVAFILAGKKYKGTESDAEDDFRNLTGSSTSHLPIEHIGMIETEPGRWRPDCNVPLQCVDPDGEYRPPENLGKLPPGAERQTLNIGVPPTEGMGFNDLWLLGEALSGYTESLTSKGSGWIRMGLQLQTGFTGFEQNMLGLVENSDRWVGEGAKGAALAVRSYLGQGQGLLHAMDMLGNNLQETVFWTFTTASNMPPESWGNTSSDHRKPTESLARTVYQNWYEPGIHSAAAAIPVLPSPTGSTTSPSGTGARRSSGGVSSGRAGDVPAGSTGAMPSIPAGAQAPQLSTAGLSDPALTTAQPAAQQRIEGRDVVQAREALVPGRRQSAERVQRSPRTRKGPPVTERQTVRQQQQQQPVAAQAAQQAQPPAGSALPQLSSAAQQAQQALQQLAANRPPGIPPGLQDAANRYQSALQNVEKALGGGSGAGGSASGGGPGSGMKTPQLPGAEKAARLFPRASLTGTAHGMSTSTVTAGPWQGSPMGGAPMGGGGGAGAGAGQQQAKEHDRADHLITGEWLDEGIGEAPIAVKPVIDS
ncbi:hypothetical protein [Nocardia sp. NPDC051750]|uniref:hypothetical protein n=1 Tax=Nocardia sp. NPDC051750 TaxID=3364325 RepID=UPI0037960A88